MARDAIHQALLRGDGFAVLREVIAPDEARRIRAEILARLDCANEEANGSLRIPNLIAAAPPFSQLATNPTILDLAHRVVGRDCRIAALGANVLMPGCSPGGMHVDYPYWAMDPGMPVEPALMLQVIWMMEPFSAENGGTWVVPGSQTWGRYPVAREFDESAIQITGNAGDAIVSHGLLWHRTAANRTDQPRVALLINYSQLTVQPMSQLGPFSDEFRENASSELRSLLGFDHNKALLRRIRSVTAQL